MFQKIGETSTEHGRAWSFTAAGVFIIALLLRIWGIRWGLPNALHSYSYHPDEFLLMGCAAGVVFFHRFLPGFYNYPSLFVYLSSLALAGGAAYGFVTDNAGPYLCLRIVSALMGTGAVAGVYWAGKKLFGVVPGLIAAVILCVAPLHVQHSHFATVDVSATLFVALAIGFAAKAMKSGALGDYSACGVMIGLAAGTKYNAGVVVLSLIAAHLMGRKLGARRLADVNILVSIGCAIAAFLISTPGVILDNGKFLQDLSYEAHHSSVGHDLVFAGTGSGFIYTFAHSLWYGLGPALAVLLIASLVFALIKRDRNVGIILAFILPYYAIISLSQVRFARYSLPIYPGIALLVGWFIFSIWNAIGASPRQSAKWIWVGVCVAALGFTIVYTASLEELLVLPDPRDRAARFIATNIAKGSNIAVFDVPWFYSPPLSKDIGFGALQQRTDAMQKAPYVVTVLSESDDTILDRRNAPRWVIASDFEIYDAQRLRHNTSLNKDMRRRVDNINLELDAISQRYRIAGRFRNELRAFGIPTGLVEKLPHDMKYPAPTITIYELKS